MKIVIYIYLAVSITILILVIFFEIYSRMEIKRINRQRNNDISLPKVSFGPKRNTKRE